MTLDVSADAPANIAQRVGSDGRAAHADIDVQLLVAEPTSGFDDPWACRERRARQLPKLLLSAGVEAVLGGRRAADARDEQRVSDSELR